MSKKWIAGAISHPGALTKKAKAAGESPMAFAHEHAHSPGRTGKQARLALTLRKMHKASGGRVSTAGHEESDTSDETSDSYGSIQRLKRERDWEDYEDD